MSNANPIERLRNGDSEFDGDKILDKPPTPFELCG